MARIAVDVDRLQKYMEDREMSPAELSKAMGVSRSTVTRILRDERKAGAEFIGRLVDACPDAWEQGVIFLHNHCQSTTTKFTRLAAPETSTHSSHATNSA